MGFNDSLIAELDNDSLTAELDFLEGVVVATSDPEVCDLTLSKTEFCGKHVCSQPSFDFKACPSTRRKPCNFCAINAQISSANLCFCYSRLSFGLHLFSVKIIDMVVMSTSANHFAFAARSTTVDTWSCNQTRATSTA